MRQVVATALAVGVFGAGFVAGSVGADDEQAEPVGASTGGDASPDGTLPEGIPRELLVGVIGDNGREGYVDEVALHCYGAEGSPEEMLAAQEAARARVLPVYGPDGRTIIDSFTISPPNASSP